MKVWKQHEILWFFCVFFSDRISLCTPACPGTHSADSAGFKLRDPPFFASQVLGFQGVCATTTQQNDIFGLVWFLFVWIFLQHEFYSQHCSPWMLTRDNWTNKSWQIWVMKLDVGSLHEEETKDNVWLAKEELRKCRNGFDCYFSQTERHIVYALIVLEYATENKTSQNSER